jgi:soluble lytic murein transglycosylase-like protein
VSQGDKPSGIGRITDWRLRSPVVGDWGLLLEQAGSLTAQRGLGPRGHDNRKPTLMQSSTSGLMSPARRVVGCSVAAALTLAACTLPARAADTREEAGEPHSAGNLGSASAPASIGPPQSIGAGQFEDAILKAAAAFELPASFFLRLIWQESRFDPRAVSPAGAQGIAQFMPGTARWRGLADPFVPDVALLESARWLRELWSEFGNLGLAAAAYNAGPARVTQWLKDRSNLPAETRAYVRIVTGHDAEVWAECAADASQAGRTECPKHLPAPPVSRPKERLARTDQAEWAPWGLQLIGDWSEARALADYRNLQLRFPHVLGDRKALVLRGRMAGRGSATWYRVRVAESTRARAQELCGRLERAGGKCLVLHN